MTLEPAPATTPTRIAWGCVWLLGLATVLVIFRQPPEVMTDAGTCLLAAEQFYQRGNIDFHTLVETNASQLDQQLATPITWWPASYAGFPYFFRSLGFNWGQSLQIVILFGWLLGTWGWTRFFRLLLSPAILPWFLATFLMFRYTHANANVYDAGEFVFWAFFPWVLLINLQAMQTVHVRHGRAAILITLAGILTTLLVTVKYSAGLSALGIAMGWIFVVWMHQVPRRQLGFWILGASLGTILVSLSGLLPAGNPGTVRSGIQWTALCWGPGAWTFAMTDLESLVARLLLDRPGSWLPAIGRYGDGRVTLLAPITLGLLLGLWFMVGRERKGTDPNSTWNSSLSSADRSRVQLVVVVHLVTFTVVLTGMIFAGSAIHMDSRFLRPAAIALLPWVIAGIVKAIHAAQFSTRLVGYTTLGLFIVIPAGYGAATAVYKTVVRGQAAAARTGPLGIRHDLLDEAGNANTFYKELQQLRAGPTTTYYLLEHALALPLAKQPVIIEHAHLRIKEHLAGKRYLGRPVDGMVLVVPRRFADNGKLAIIQESFLSIHRWQTRGLASQPDWLVSISQP